MYKKDLFIRGNKSFLKTRGNIIPMRAGRGSCSGSGAGLDNYLLSLVKGVSLASKPKKTKSRTKSGGALKFIR